ncbi:hypothetical protein [Paenibacillus agilis]|uniref:Uncharacterized protein n=1 Tax=Paenibacillus agilis TaxID=3020863 RepID=A0A559IDP4_9BACL|nr:hypothetical protein [Paenibacillus agilis]TVX85640.1 hypothetical protein FPZ44_25145 [Paenibacillus agilis]
MWTKEEVIISLLNDEMPKRKMAEFLQLVKPWNKYKREEFAELVAYEASVNIELSNQLDEHRLQFNAREELWDLYLTEQNTNPPVLTRKDWVTLLREYKEANPVRKKYLGLLPRPHE